MCLFGLKGRGSSQDRKLQQHASMSLYLWPTKSWLSSPVWESVGLPGHMCTLWPHFSTSTNRSCWFLKGFKVFSFLAVVQMIWQLLSPLCVRADLEVDTCYFPHKPLFLEASRPRTLFLRLSLWVLGSLETFHTKLKQRTPALLCWQ